MVKFIKNSKGQIISAEHLRQIKTKENSYNETFEVIGIFSNGDEVFIEAYSTEAEAEEAVSSITGDVMELSHEPKVLAPDKEVSETFRSIIEGPDEEEAFEEVSDELTEEFHEEVSEEAPENEEFDPEVLGICDAAAEYEANADLIPDSDLPFEDNDSSEDRAENEEGDEDEREDGEEGEDEDGE